MLFIGSLVALSRPEKVFEETIKDGWIIPGIVSNCMLASLWIMIGYGAIGVFSIKYGVLTQSYVPLLTINMPFITAIGAFFFDLILSQFSAGGTKLKSKYYNIFLCELHVFPNVFAMLFFWAIAMYCGNMLLIVLGLILTLRFLEQQVRIIQVVHNKSLEEAYLLMGILLVLLIVSVILSKLLKV